MRIGNTFKALLLILALLAQLSPVRAYTDGPMPLSAYPRPPQDNGRGVHWSPTLFGQPKEMVDSHLNEAQAMDIKWIKVLQGDAPKLEHEYLIGAAIERGMMPVLRIFQPWNEPYQHLSEIVRLGTGAGVHYYELYNEPNISGQAGGWRPNDQISVDRIVELWIDAAETVTSGGGLPGLPALAPGGDYDDTEFLRSFLKGIRQRGKLNLLYKAWLPLHNYFLNHPFDYPYDEVNLHSVPLTESEIAKRALTAEEVQSINHYRSISRLPRSQGGYYVGDNIYADSNSFLKFQAYARILEEECGFVIPIITTEGGVIIGSQEDPRYPPTNEDDLVERTVAAFDYMRQAPPYYFAFMPWLLANRAGNSVEAAWEGAAWIKEDGSTLPIVVALQNSTSPPVQIASPTPPPTATPVPSQPQPTVVTAANNASYTKIMYRLRLPDLESALQPSMPSHPRYPLRLLPAGTSPSIVEREYEVVVLSNDLAEVWVLPAIGGRIIKYQDKRSGHESIPLVTELQLRREGTDGYRLEGGLAWIYPSVNWSLVDAIPWQVEVTNGENGTGLHLSCQETRSHTTLAVDIFLRADGSLDIKGTVANVNGEARVVSLAPSIQALGLDAQTEIVLGAQESRVWAASFNLSGATPAATPSTSLPAMPTPSATPYTNSNAGNRPIALVTPVPASDSKPQYTPSSWPQAPSTPVAPATPSVPGANSQLSLDPRLTAMEIKVKTDQSARWRLVAAAYEDERESGGQHHIFVNLIDSNGNPCDSGSDVPFVSWKDGRQELEVRQNADGSFSVDFPMYGPLGSYTVGIGNSTDTIVGLGLPGNLHVNYRLTFQRQS